MKRTPLYDAHVALGAKMVPFAGYDMPLEYKGILKEHESCRQHVGLFDVSHMGEVEVKGKDAKIYCQKMTCNDVSLLKPGKIQYSAILNEQGGVIDDCTVYCMAEDHFLLVINAGFRSEVVRWLKSHESDFKVTVQDRSDEFGMIAVQGKKAESLLASFSGRELSTLHYFEWMWMELAGVPVIVSRTGYTGEDGFELYIPWDKTADIWSKLLELGEPYQVAPIGLGARDVLRLEMGYLLSGTDMSASKHALESSLAWVCKFDKGQFVGRDTLLELKTKNKYPLLRGIIMEEKAIPRSHYAVYADESAQTLLGEITSGTYSPSLKLGIALARLARPHNMGDNVFVEVRKGKLAKGKICKPPFVDGSVKK